MVAAPLFNQRAGHEITPIYGVVTTGTNWKFITLGDRVVSIDVDEYLTGGQRG